MTSKQLVPKGRHWMILKFSSVQVSGRDEDLDSNEPIVRYEAYNSKKEWEAAVSGIEKSQHSEDYFAAEVNPADVAVHVLVSTS
ncbi:MAG TPA: hypothetical protein VJC06_00625 [Candidatus Paceibacterota bacterium]